MVKVSNLQPHRQFNGTVVVYLQFASRPDNDLLNILRSVGHYRKGPNNGAGWHIRLELAAQCANQLAKAGYENLSTHIHDCAKYAKKNPPPGMLEPTANTTGKGPRKGKSKYSEIIRVV
jgi:hypothetical protein